MQAAKTIFCDIDGVIFKHEGEGACNQWSGVHTLLPGIKEAFNVWEKAGYCIVLVTSRKESCRALLEEELRVEQLFWDHLIMGLPHGERIIINDRKKDGPSVSSVLVERNSGL